MLPPAYAPLIAALSPPARLWRIAAGVLVIALVYFLWNLGLGTALWWIEGLDGLDSRLQTMSTGSDPLAMLLLFSTFIGGFLGVWLAMRLLHRRPMGALFGRAPAVLRDFVLGLGMMAVVGGGLSVLMLPLLPDLELTADPQLWLMVLPLALLGVLIQTGAEEAVFRGYLQGQLAARFAAPLVWMGVPTVLFGLAHYSPEAMGDNTWLVVLATGLFGLIASDLTARSGSLGLAWGLHFANNVMAILIVSLSGTLDGLALLHPAGGAMAADHLQPLLFADIALLVIVWMACRIWLRRR
jgi:membrane protease YdiL (CAAX protease family)